MKAKVVFRFSMYPFNICCHNTITHSHTHIQYTYNTHSYPNFHSRGQQMSASNPVVDLHSTISMAISVGRNDFAQVFKYLLYVGNGFFRNSTFRFLVIQKMPTPMLLLLY